MTLFFPDLNVWMALSVNGHTHGPDAWNWLRQLSKDSRLIWSRYTQIGLLRLLTNTAVMGDRTLTLSRAWKVYDQWIEDPRVDFYPEPRGIDREFRDATDPVAKQFASKWVGDCWLLGFAAGAQATLVTFDRALYEFSRKHGYSCITPNP